MLPVDRAKLCGCGIIMSLLLSNCANICLLIENGSVCRRHPIPTREMLEPLLRTAAAVGLILDVSSSKALAESLDRAVVSLCIWLILSYACCLAMDFFHVKPCGFA
jgi:hypothetical protein